MTKTQEMEMGMEREHGQKESTCECGSPKDEQEEFCPSCNKAIMREINNQKYFNNL